MPCRRIGVEPPAMTSALSAFLRGDLARPVQPVDRLGPGSAELLAAVDQHPPTTSSGSTWTWTRFGVRGATIATECASTGSVLRPLPDVARWAGQSLSSAQLAQVYGFTDLDGSRGRGTTTRSWPLASRPTPPVTVDVPRTLRRRHPPPR
jgi:hypothetical protein